MVAGSGTFIDELLKLNHFENCYSNRVRYPEIKLQNMALENNPDLVFLSSEPYPFQEKHVDEINENAPQAKTILVDGEMFSWHGSRLLKAFAYFKQLH